MRIWLGPASWVKHCLCFQCFLFFFVRTRLTKHSYTNYTVSHLSLYFYPAGSFFTGQSSKNNEEVSLIRKADLENHNKDGGFWTVIDGKVYDIKDFQAQSQSLAGNSILGKSIS